MSPREDWLWPPHLQSNEHTKRIIIDLDGTITYDDRAKSYADRLPNLQVVEKLREHKALGFEIVIHSSRNMLTYRGDIGKINVHTLPVILVWLRGHNIPHDEILVAIRGVVQSFFMSTTALSGPTSSPG